ncbi:MAG: aldolase, partial [Verrucomicrobia bacterium]|nr:aldolase [Verrucomicrobiota bacterium]
MKQFRLNRLFNSRSGHPRCFDVAIDHGFFNERGFLAGIENLDKAVRTVVAAAPDAIQLTVGQAHYLQSLPGKEKPALVLR